MVGSNNYNNAYINFASAASEIADQPAKQKQQAGASEDKGKPMGAVHTCLFLFL